MRPAETEGIPGAGVPSGATAQVAGATAAVPGSVTVSPATSAVVVNHNAGEHLQRCVESLLVAGAVRVVVVDNASGDGSAEALRARRDLPSVRVVDAGTNLGYGSAVNRGMATLAEELVLVCNPDVVVETGTLQELAGVLAAAPVAGVAGPSIWNTDGSLYPSARRFPSYIEAGVHALAGLFVPGNRLSRRYRMEGELGTPGEGEPVGVGEAVRDNSGTKARQVDWVSGAIFLARRRALEEVRGFDEGYFMYGEDVDLCWRLGRAGWGVLYVPGARAVHEGAVSTSRQPYRMILAHHRSTLRFAVKTSTGWRRLLVPAAAAVLGIRLVAALLRQQRSGKHRRPPA